MVPAVGGLASPQVRIHLIAGGLCGALSVSTPPGPRHDDWDVYRLRPRAWFVTKEQNQALVEALGPNTTNFQSWCPRFTLLTNQALV